MRPPDPDVSAKGSAPRAGRRIVFRGEGSSAWGTSSRVFTPASPRIFLLSPANASGVRSQMLIAGKAQFDLARRLRETGAPLSELFAFMSSLYFRGKLAYAQAFAHPPSGLPGILIITPARGLLRPEAITTLADLREMSSSSVKHTNPAFREPLERDARLLLPNLGPDGLVILLGSVATLKYVDPLLRIFGDRLIFPCDFAGRGNMSRGALLLRHSRGGDELRYIPVSPAVTRKPHPLGRSGRKPAAAR